MWLCNADDPRLPHAHQVLATDLPTGSRPIPEAHHTHQASALLPVSAVEEKAAASKDPLVTRGVVDDVSAEAKYDSNTRVVTASVATQHDGEVNIRLYSPVHIHRETGWTRVYPFTHASCSACWNNPQAIKKRLGAGAFV